MFSTSRLGPPFQGRITRNMGRFLAQSSLERVAPGNRHGLYSLRDSVITGSEEKFTKTPMDFSNYEKVLRVTYTSHATNAAVAEE